MEMVWEGSEDLGDEADLFTGLVMEMMVISMMMMEVVLIQGLS